MQFAYRGDRSLLISILKRIYQWNGKCFYLFCEVQQRLCLFCFNEKFIEDEQNANGITTFYAIAYTK